MNKLIQWKELEYPARFTSAAGTISHGFSQFYTDIINVADYFSNHLDSCHICNIKEKRYCVTIEKAKIEIFERFSNYKDFFNAINSLEKMLSWCVRIYDEPIRSLENE